MDDLGFTAFVALSDADEIIAGPLRRRFAEVSPSSSLILEQCVAGDALQAYRVSVDGHDFVVALFTGPIPQVELTFAIRKSLFWPDAGLELQGHRGFLAIAAAQRQTRHGLARAQSIALTRFLAALVEVVPAAGVYWRGGETCSPPQRLADAPGQINRGKWPVDVWIGYQLFRKDAQAALDVPQVVGMQTRGAAAYLGFEIEIPPYEVAELKEPLRILYNAAGYLMNYGDVIRDGQIVEVEGERRTSYQLHLGARGEPGLARLSVLETDHRKMN
ncbi:MAG: hypothetical protein AAFV19_03990 [Pseudomonadota bacterium]